ncbi:hypothetical protein KYY02_27895 [Streptomyces pimonensis]|uniref:Secreted protein n=1 Tax=Streptomyces pimonensis TaxID=2860288 RepID=A0ABV4J8M0_9ACTN
MLVTTAVVMIVTGARGLTAEDDAEWSDDELTSAGEQAVTALDGTSGTEISSGSDSAVGQGDAMVIENEAVEHGGGDAPQLGVDARPAADDTACTVMRDGAGAAFCVDLQRTRSREHDWLWSSKAAFPVLVSPSWATVRARPAGAAEIAAPVQLVELYLRGAPLPLQRVGLELLPLVPRHGRLPFPCAGPSAPLQVGRRSAASGLRCR